MKKLVAVVLLLIGVLVMTVLGRTAMFTSKQPAPSSPAALEFDEVKAVGNLQRALRFKTISHQNKAEIPVDEFGRFHAFLRDAYPKVHRALKLETIGGLSLLYTWPGSEPELPPVLFLAHQDVVPIAAPDKWDQEPFAGELADGFIWGRGALDDKASVTGLLEAAEALLAEGYQPRRTVLFAFGHDEEVGGWNGAHAVAAHLEAQGIRPEFLLDEGMAVVEGVVPGISKPVALIGLTEKGYLTLELTAEGPGGHSSQPPSQTALGILSAAVVKLEENPFPAALEGPMRDMFDYLGPEMSFPMRAVFANLWLLQGLIKKQFLSHRTTAAALRTTTAVTILEGGTKENVLPATARAVVNFRLAPWDTSEEVIAYVKRTIGDERVQVKILGRANETPPPSDTDSRAYGVIAQSIVETFPETIVGPSMMLGGSDSHHYSEVAENAYRFGPIWLTEDDMERIHGPNERISKTDYLRAIRFFAQMIRNGAV